MTCEERIAELEARIAELEKRAERPLSQASLRVLDALHQLDGRAGVQEIAGLLPGVRRVALRVHLRRMERRALLRRPCYGVYEAPQ